MHFTRESIFITTLRSFCTCLAAVIGILLGILIVATGFSVVSGPDVYPEKSNLTLAPDIQGAREWLPSSAPVILKLNLTSVIGQGDLTYQKFQNLLLDSQEGMLAPHRVKGLLLYINSPGGVANDGVAIYEALKAYKAKYKVPIYAFVDGLCASAGLYIACAADKIFATSSSIIGSVGVLMGPTFNFSGLMERYGVQSLTLTAGKDKDMLNSFRPWEPGEDASLRQVMDALYQQFVQAVTNARPQLDPDKLVNEYGAQVYISEQAARLGYIDVADATYMSSLQALMQAAELKMDAPCQVIELTPPRFFLSDFTSCFKTLFQGKITHCFQIAPYMNSELSGQLLYLYQPIP